MTSYIEILIVDSIFFNWYFLLLFKLQNWLLQLLGDEACPDLQSDVHDIKYLWILKKRYDESEKNATEEIKLKKTRIYSLNNKSKFLPFIIAIVGHNFSLIIFIN